MQVQDIMTRQVVTAAPDASIRDVAILMSEIDSGVIPVIDGDLLGIVTDRDIVIRAVAEGLDTNRPVSEIMTSGIESCLETDELREAASRMSELQMRRLLVFDNAGTIKGIISLGDIALLNEELAGVALEEISDDASRQ
ncbi:CBS domain-containing protein [Rhizobium mesosinicum]|uniref:CBS domain-containing protein n=1 Tax=Rhizobium mesosinicum TaxID=335017 RepID=A0ABS7GNL3_9HYPH|nr:CBS domain-containing protein [Rhizobium mesosinicum]MBW9051236.1 CBS domain-containing protein [Rhizobium mesosinicum]